MIHKGRGVKSSIKRIIVYNKNNFAIKVFTTIVIMCIIIGSLISCGAGTPTGRSMKPNVNIPKEVQKVSEEEREIEISLEMNLPNRIYRF